MVQDIAEKSFWDKYPPLKPFAQLARWDRPIGFWLLFWPCVWGAALAPHFQDRNFQYKLWPIFLFFIGAIAMRGAGCTLNDLLDRKLDAKVTRTKNRPLPSGTVHPVAAVVFLMLQLAVGGWVLFQLPNTAIMIGFL
ncbi:MAG: 4-hydroxybenzoate octaprenyltransferase, partial [Alphaproteobacteria bacterium]|nr:4-hydroxybenzoate octaprenyltransferase [Alphaproteobacteria bacterium]